MEHNNEAAHVDLGQRQEAIADKVRWMLAMLNKCTPGEIDDDQHLQGTPDRFTKFLMEFLPDPRPFEEIVKTSFRSGFEEMVAVTNIRFTALCAHHLLPFRGMAHVAYVPGSAGKIVGLSKLSRAVEYFAHRITIQEDITRDIVEALSKVLEPKGVMIVVEAEHECMAIRGVKQPGATTITSAVRGCFLSNEKGSKDEFLHLVRMNGVHS